MLILLLLKASLGRSGNADREDLKHFALLTMRSLQLGDNVFSDDNYKDEEGSGRMVTNGSF